MIRLRIRRLLGYSILAAETRSPRSGTQPLSAAKLVGINPKPLNPKPLNKGLVTSVGRMQAHATSGRKTRARLLERTHVVPQGIKVSTPAALSTTEALPIGP